MTMYVAGWNQYGHPPNSDPERFGSFTDAVAYLRELVDQFWTEDLEDIGELPDVRDSVNARWKPVRDALTKATADPDDISFAGFSGDGWYAFWVAPEFDREGTR